MTTAYIYEAVRTPRSKGKPDGSLHDIKPWELGAGLFREIQTRYDLDTAYVDDVILGCVTQTGDQGGNVAKAAVQTAGWDESVPAVTLNRYCASGLEAVNTAAQRVASGWEHLVVAGGVESMSRVPMGSDGGALFTDDHFIETQSSIHQGVSADLLATLDGVGRTDLDTFAMISQQRAHHAQTSGYFDRSVVPVRDRSGEVILESDNFLKPNTTLEILAGLKASFTEMGAKGMDELALRKYPQLNAIKHVHTAGNSSGIVDGASAVLVGSERAGRDLGLEPRGRIVAGAILSTEPTLMLAGPGPAAKKCLHRAGMTVNDIDIFEINEAFSAVVLRYMRDLNISEEVTNVNGGAIALGHPLGATGAMMVGITLDELERTNKRRALLSLCVGLGMGIVTIVERV